MCKVCFTNLTKHIEVSYQVASLFFHTFSCVSYRNDSAEVPQSCGTSSTSKHMNRVGSILFGRNSYISVFVTRVRCLKTFLDCILNRSSFSRVHLITKEFNLMKNVTYVWQLFMSTSNTTLEVPLPYAPDPGYFK